MARALLLALLAALACATAAVKLTKETLTFGHAVKNGALPAVNASNAETTTFEHTCVTAPCTINQLHVPSIYPKNTADWAWQEGVIRFYVDGETEASIQLKLLELSWVSEYASPAHRSLQPGSSGGQYDNRGLPWGIADFGHTASSGGVSSTIRIPFGKSIRVTIQAPPNTFTTSVYWMIVRGIENSAVILGELELPPSARLKMYRVNTTLSAGELVTLAEAPAGTSGALVGTKFDANGHNDGYLEACMRFYPNAKDAATNSTPIFLSSGAEDYFLSASYFDEGEFISPNSGLTYKAGGAIGSYKLHDLRDQVVYHDGFALQFRAGETTQGCGSELLCPNQFCPAKNSDGQREARDDALLTAEVQQLLEQRRAERTAAAVSKAPSECVVGPIAYGFDRPGGGGSFDSMKLPGGKKCSGVDMVNATGCDAEACAAMCCNNPKCLSFVHGIAAGCDQTAPKDPQAVCCWMKEAATQLTIKQADYLATGEVAGPDRTVSPTPSPGPGPSPPAPPAPAVPKDVYAIYSTLVFTYEWPAADTPSVSPAEEETSALRGRLNELSTLLAEGVITQAEHNAARQAALGI